ncbi:very short patch repair endonuclease [Jeongeupia naejangsanensis]|uniref:DNA mismatch endonuclease Vsr n=1 Tax=Jeongeupia naejangsanensis TaxID=613195 RepID=A0ABS2BF64_9NEIS|nr:very short patch repair endonuclease [Jeongeupia naejangsanensis]MBM3114251.1 DNA mismatch endonuclease Vsr [Jeongeupia naejangsanensis]
MTDIVDQATRSRMMSGIRGKNTKPEMLIRKALHARGFRYRLHAPDLPGKPDLVFPRYKAVLFVHGCFWHGHPGCKHFRLPGTRTDFWASKITANCVRDSKQQHLLIEKGWRVLVIWECATRKLQPEYAENVFNLVCGWLKSDTGSAQLDANGLSPLPCSVTESATTLKVLPPNT